jgi:hypothetical protein
MVIASSLHSFLRKISLGGLVFVAMFGVGVLRQ